MEFSWSFKKLQSFNLILNCFVLGTNSYIADIGGIVVKKELVTEDPSKLVNIPIWS